MGPRLAGNASAIREASKAYLDGLAAASASGAGQQASTARSTTNGTDLWYTSTQLTGDMMFVCPSRRVAAALSSHGTPVYLYHFAHRSKCDPLYIVMAYVAITIYTINVCAITI